MRILWHGPFGTPTGYWNQARTWIPRIRDAGHEVAISCLAGVVGHMTNWDGVPVYPMSPYENYGQDTVQYNYEHFGADLVITLTCTWVLAPPIWQGMRTIHITPVDCEGMSARDYQVIAGSGGHPAAVCRWGETQMRARELDPLYLPHGVETDLYRPPEDWQATRKRLGIDDMFVVGINAGNHDKTRKCWSEAIGGFAAFHAKHPKSLLAIHANAMLPNGLKLDALVREWGVDDVAIFSPPGRLNAGAYTDADMAQWYGTLDVLMNIGNEGFGVPTVEAQACGTPVIVGNYSASQELCGAGWLVKGQKYWNDHHEKFWYMPFIASVAGQLEKAYKRRGDMTLRRQAREWSLRWDADRMFADHWTPVLKELTG